MGQIGHVMAQRICQPGPGPMFTGPEAMDDSIQMQPVGIHPELMAEQDPAMRDQMLKHAVCNLINYQVGKHVANIFFL